MPNTLNPSVYNDAVSKLAGGKRRKHSKGGKSRSRKHQNKQRGGFFPGLGGIIQQALVPFGLYALQHSMKKRGNKSSSYSASAPSFRKFTRRR